MLELTSRASFLPCPSQRGGVLWTDGLRRGGVLWTDGWRRGGVLWTDGLRRGGVLWTDGLSRDGVLRFERMIKCINSEGEFVEKLYSSTCRAVIYERFGCELINPSPPPPPHILLKTKKEKEKEGEQEELVSWSFFKFFFSLVNH